MIYALCNYKITSINVGSNLLGDETSLSAQKLVREGYSKPEILRILRLDTLGTVSVFIVDLNAKCRQLHEKLKPHRKNCQITTNNKHFTAENVHS